eukprot:7588415-Pyramimonas_sp.AAC.1
MGGLPAEAAHTFGIMARGSSRALASCSAWPRTCRSPAGAPRFGGPLRGGDACSSAWRARGWSLFVAERRLLGRRKETNSG